MCNFKSSKNYLNTCNCQQNLKNLKKCCNHQKNRVKYIFQATITPKNLFPTKYLETILIFCTKYSGAQTILDKFKFVY